MQRNERERDRSVLPPPPARPVRIGVIGTGGIARSSHLPALASLQAAGWPITVGALADPSPAALAAAVALAPELLQSARHFSEGQALLSAADRNCDALLLLTPPEILPSLLRGAMASGMPVFAEKPVAEDTATLAALSEEASRLNAPVQVGYNRRWLPLLSAFDAEVEAIRATGAPLHIEAHLWRANRSEAIFYRDTMIHAVDFLLRCFGPLTRDRVSTGPPVVPGGIISGLRAELRSEAAALQTVHLDVRPAVGQNRESYTVFGNGVCATLHYPPQDRHRDAANLTIWRGGKADTREVPALFLSDAAQWLWTRGFLGQMAAFVHRASEYALGTPPAPVCGLAEALAARQLTDAILAPIPNPSPNSGGREQGSNIG